MVSFVVGNIGRPYEEDYFLKDVGFATGRSIPCGAQVIELTCRVSAIRALRSIGIRGNAIPILKLFKAGGPGMWLRIHTESRYLEEFNEDGWNACYRRIAELLRIANGYRGMLGTSWFYDPQVAQISPNLSYLQAIPMANGAVRVRHRVSAADIQRATLKSRTRRKMFEEGRYSPGCYSIFWPKRQLLNWAARHTGDAGP